VVAFKDGKIIRTEEITAGVSGYENQQILVTSEFEIQPDKFFISGSL
jgi:hypothetical protein